MRPTPLPAELATGPFHIRDARRLGVQPHRLRAGDLETPYPGIRTHRLQHPPTTDDDPRARHLARAVLLEPRLSGMQLFSHVTAAALWGIPVPAFRLDGPLHVAALRPAREPRIAGVLGVATREVVKAAGGGVASEGGVGSSVIVFLEPVGVGG